MAKSSSIAFEVKERSREIAPGIQVGRVLPARPPTHVGPFVFLDHGGPLTYAAGRGIDVLPHPHIGLATVTYLFEGEILHRDSLGSQRVIRPGEINWMTASRGIVHSERTPPEARRSGSRLHVLQFWVGLPQARELDEPRFDSYGADVLPIASPGGARVRILAGAAYGARSPVETASPLFLADAHLPADAELRPPPLLEGAAFIVEGSVRCEDAVASPGTLLVFAPEAAPALRAEKAARLVLMGGAPLDGPRHIWWNFVSSSQERIVEAARAWREGRFPKVPGDEAEAVPLHEEPHFAKDLQKNRV